MTLIECYQLALELLGEHHLEAWDLDFDLAVRRLGVCRHDKRVIGLAVRHVLDHPDRDVRDTILHEIAHALAPSGAGHGPAWKRVARKLGCEPKGATPVYSLAEPRYVATCLVCGRSLGCNRLRRRSCGSCCAHYDNRFRLRYEDNPLWEIEQRRFRAALEEFRQWQKDLDTTAVVNRRSRQRSLEARLAELASLASLALAEA